MHDITVSVVANTTTESIKINSDRIESYSPVVPGTKEYNNGARTAIKIKNEEMTIFTEESPSELEELIKS